MSIIFPRSSSRSNDVVWVLFPSENTSRRERVLDLWSRMTSQVRDGTYLFPLKPF